MSDVKAGVEVTMETPSELEVGWIATDSSVVIFSNIDVLSMLTDEDGGGVTEGLSLLKASDGLVLTPASSCTLIQIL